MGVLANIALTIALTAPAGHTQSALATMPNFKHGSNSSAMVAAPPATGPTSVVPVVRAGAHPDILVSSRDHGPLCAGFWRSRSPSHRLAARSNSTLTNSAISSANEPLFQRSRICSLHPTDRVSAIVVRGRSALSAQLAGPNVQAPLAHPTDSSERFSTISALLPSIRVQTGGAGAAPFLRAAYPILSLAGQTSRSLQLVTIARFATPPLAQSLVHLSGLPACHRTPGKVLFVTT